MSGITDLAPAKLAEHIAASRFFPSKAARTAFEKGARMRIRRQGKDPPLDAESAPHWCDGYEAADAMLDLDAQCQANHPSEGSSP